MNGHNNIEMLASQLETLEKNVQRVCSKMRSMTTLQFGDKWNSVKQAPDKATILTSIMRTLYYWNESAEMSVADFNSTLEEAFTLTYECIDKYAHYPEDGRNTLARLIVSLTDNISNVKMAIVRQKGAYLNDPTKEGAKNAMEDTITYVNDQLAAVNTEIQRSKITQKIMRNVRTRRVNHNPIIVPMTDEESPSTVTTPDESLETTPDEPLETTLESSEEPEPYPEEFEVTF